MNKQWKKVKISVCDITGCIEKHRAYLLRTVFAKRGQNDRTRQHCGVETGTVTPYFYHVFIISLTCYKRVPCFIGNLCLVLLPGNHLKLHCLLLIMNEWKNGFQQNVPWALAIVTIAVQKLSVMVCHVLVNLSICLLSNQLAPRTPWIS